MHCVPIFWENNEYTYQSADWSKCATQLAHKMKSVQLYFQQTSQINSNY